MLAGMHAVSVITAARRPDSALLAEAWCSLRAQEADWEWCIQLDGAESRVPDEIAADPRVRVGAAPSSPLGPAAARNLAVLNSQSRLLHTLDCDDVLLPGALAGVIRAMRANREAAYAFGRSVDLLPDGSIRRFVMPFQPGLIEPGKLAAAFEERRREGAGFRGSFPVHCAGVTWSRPHLLAHGGYAAMLRSEDISVLLAIAESHAGVYVDQETFLYRRHPAQMTHGPDDAPAAVQGEAMVLARLAAIRELAGGPGAAAA